MPETWMPNLSADSMFEVYKQHWEAPRGLLGLTEQFCNVSHFLCRLRTQLRYGELTRAPLKLLRLQLSGDTLECDWLAREADPWDTDLPKRVMRRHTSLQTLHDAISIRSLIFRTFPGTDAASLRIYRETEDSEPELIVAGHVHRNDHSSRWVHSLAMRAKNLGFRFHLQDENLCGLPGDKSPVTAMRFEMH
jgi:hypothetical protein